MIPDSFPATRVVRGFTAAFLAMFTAAALAQDPAPAEETTPPAEAEAPADEAPAEGSAETVEQTIPVNTDEVPATPGTQELDSIQVTGSRLKRTDYESAQPVVSISREDIERTGLTDISQILRHLTVAGNNSLSAQQGRFAISYGEVNLDLRNLGASRTLLLVNGRRWVTGLNPSSPSVSDYNTIPTSIIERVEILKDGASAIYGSDAIGGVVNVITRKDYEGFGVSYHLGHFVEEGDGINQQANLNWGRTRPGSSLFVNLSYTDQDRAPNESRSLTASPASGIVRQSAVTTRGTYVLINPTQNNASLYGCPNAPGLGANTENPAPVGPPQFGAGVIQCTLQRNVDADPSSSTPTDYHEGSRFLPNPDPDDVYNRFGGGSLTEPNTRTALYTQFSQDVLDDMNLTLEGLYNIRLSTSVGQRGYIGGGDRFFGVPGSQSYLAYLPETYPGNPFGQDVGWDSTCPDQTSVTCAHLGTGTGSWNMRLGGDKDNQNFHDEVHTVRLGSGLTGNFEFMDLPLSWDGGYIFARNKITEIFPNPRFDRVAQALQNGVAGVPPCTAPCVPLEPFHGQAGISQAALDYIFYDAWQRNTSQQDIVYFNVTGELPLLSWLPGPVAAAIGAEFRRDQFESLADPIFSQGLLFMNSLTNTSGTTYAREAYVELGIPLLQDLPGIQSLDLDIAGRYSRYATFGDVTTGKAGLRWKPFDDLLVRGTYSTGFRAPNVGELYNGQNQSFDPLDDPCSGADPNSTTNANCTIDGTNQGGAELVQPYGLWVGNPDLQPETSRNLTYGLVYSPQWLEGFDLNLDFYEIEVEDYITIGGEVGQYFLDSCYGTARPAGSPPDSGPHCEKIHRAPDGTLQWVDTPWTNFAGREVAGIDGGINYVLPLPARFGRFKLGVEASYLKKYVSITPQGAGAAEVVNKVGTVGSQFEGYPEWKAGSVLEWKGEVYSASWSTRMAYHMQEDCGDFFDAVQSVASLGLCSDPAYLPDDPATPIDESEELDPANSKNLMKTVFYHNVQVTRQLPAYNADITIGVNNVLDQDPPLSRSNIGIYWYNYDPNHYEAPGPLGYIRVGMKF